MKITKALGETFLFTVIFIRTNERTNERFTLDAECFNLAEEKCVFPRSSFDLISFYTDRVFDFTANFASISNKSVKIFDMFGEREKNIK